MLTQKGRVFAVVILLSFVISYLIVVNGFFPFAGISVSLILFALLSFYLKKEKTPKTKVYFCFTLAFAALIMIRSQGFITFLNLVSTLLFGTLMITSKPKEELGMLDYVACIPMLLIRSIFAKSEYYPKQSGASSKKAQNYFSTVFGILVSVLVGIVVIPLLSSANPLFRSLVDNALKQLNLLNLFGNLSQETLFAWAMRFFLAIIFSFLMIKILSLMAQKEDVRLPIVFDLKNYSLTLPKVFLAGILLIFFVTQLQFYFATDALLQNMGLTNSTHAREVFTQLSIVTGILMLLLYNGRVNSNKKIDWLLITEGVFLVLMAYKSAFDYIANWGFTYKRLYGVAIATWILGILTLYTKNWLRKESLKKFLYQVSVFSGLVLLSVNLLNFDYLIYHFKEASTGEGVDHTYLQTLSPDSLSYKKQLENLDNAIKSETKGDQFFSQNPFKILNEVRYLKDKYGEKFDVRNFNLLEYLSYLEVKDTNIDDFLNYFRINL